GVDQLDACLGEPAFELDGDSEQAAGEARGVVGEELARKAVGGARLDEAGPGRLPARRRAGDRGEQKAGVVVEAVDHPSRLPFGELDLGAVDLPEVVREFPLETLARLRLPRRLWSDQVIAAKSAVDRRHRRGLDPRPLELGMDAARAPARVVP